MPYYCEATHHKSPDGCYELSGHEGKHKGFPQWGHKEFFWGEAETPTVPEGSAAVVLTREELGIIHTVLLPHQKFFPDLIDKLTDARVSL